MKWVLLALSGSLVATVGAQEFRIWTDLEQRTVEAVFESKEEETVLLRMRNGQVARVPMEGLSAADRQWIERRLADPYTGPPAEASWPRLVGREADSSVTVVKEDGEAGEFVYETENYRFIVDSRLDPALVREFGKVFEATRWLNAVLPLNLRPIPEPGRDKFHAMIFTHKSDYISAGGLPGSAGVYSYNNRALMVPFDSLGVRMVGNRVTIDYRAEDYATLVHEITHQMMNRWLRVLPMWLIEGSATYTELAEYQNGRFNFLRNDRNLASLLSRTYGNPFPMVRLETLMTMDQATWNARLDAINYVSALLLTYYFYHLDGDGKGTAMIAFFEALRELPRDGSFAPLVEEHLLRGRTYGELEEDLVRAFRRRNITIRF